MCRLSRNPTAMATSRMEEELKRKSLKAAATEADPVAKLRLQCLARGASGIKGLSRVFRIMDDNGDGTLQFSEFRKGLDDYGVYLDDDDDYRVAFDRFDTNKDGSLNFDEFLKNLRPPMSKPRIRLVRQAFQKIDKNGDGTLTKEDLKGVYDVRRHPKFISGEKTEDELLDEFLGTFEGDDGAGGKGDGKVTWEEFLNYYSGVSASIDDDPYFDLMMRQSWKL
eukprot:m.75659 g.75659  ORF g.75659 m.75659 type:complete len:223 (+) comp12454_c4_seq1:52-720(+)